GAEITVRISADDVASSRHPWKLSFAERIARGAHTRGALRRAEHHRNVRDNVSIRIAGGYFDIALRPSARGASQRNDECHASDVDSHGLLLAESIAYQTQVRLIFFLIVTNP